MEKLRLDEMSDERVLERVEVLIRRSNETTAELLAYLAEVDSRGLHLREACGSLFAYCVERLHMSEAAAGKRITAARAARRFPLVLEMIAQGDIHLSGLSLLASHLTDQNHAELLRRARHLSKRAIEKLVAEIAPRPDVASRVVALPRRGFPVGEPARAQELTGAQEVHAPGRALHAPSPSSSPAAAPSSVVAPLAPRRYQIRVTVDEETHAALCQLQDLLSHQLPDRDPAVIISRALDLLLQRTLAKKAAATERPRDEQAPGKRTRHIPAAVRRKVWRRDGGQCAFVDPKGRRCSSTRFLEYHHLHNWARGAGHDPAEMELRCRAHNQFQARLDYGAEFMAAKVRGRSSCAQEAMPTYGSAHQRAAGRRQGRAARRVAAGPPASDRFGAEHSQPGGRNLGLAAATHAVAGVAAALVAVHRHASGPVGPRQGPPRRFPLPGLHRAAALHLEFSVQHGDRERDRKQHGHAGLPVARLAPAFAVRPCVAKDPDRRGSRRQSGRGIGCGQPVGIGAGQPHVRLDPRWPALDPDQRAGRGEERQDHRARRPHRFRR